MRKVLVIGSGGAGKSTLAVRLGKVLDLPVVHLDRLHWKPGWVEPDKTEWRETVSDLIAKDEWVIEFPPQTRSYSWIFRPPSVFGG